MPVSGRLKQWKYNLNESVSFNTTFWLRKGNQMWTMYVIQNDYSNELYFGFTSNLKRRLEQHNARENISTRRKQGIWILIYAEAYRSQTDAYNREQRLKHHGSAKHELMKRLRFSRL